ncbi:MAG: UDP-glucose/GDP-mannose dehydrogenase family protein [Candidatus Woesearchaeota archaeon]
MKVIQMNISISGTGYVGLIQGVGLAKLGNKVMCVDINKEKVDAINNKKAPIYEKGLSELITKLVPKQLTATTNLKKAVMESQVTFICVGTPSSVHGEIRLHEMERICTDIGKILRQKKQPHVIVVKSTVVPGTCEKVVIPTLERASKKKFGKDFGVVMNPEFLREGSAIEDFFHPDRIVLGSSDQKAINTIKNLYKWFKCPVLETRFGEAEMIKYASNSLLATKISFINEVGNICKRLGIDTNQVAVGVGLDYRIGPHFLRSGIGFGGSCFPKDVAALVHKSLELGYHPRIMRAALDVNRDQPLTFLELVEETLGTIKGKKIALLGLTFKAETDDVRESPSLTIIKELILHQAELFLYDPMGMPAVKTLFPHLNYAESAQEAVNKAEVICILTEWPEFSKVNYGTKQVIDGKNVFEKAKRPKNYQGICW